MMTVEAIHQPVFFIDDEEDVRQSGAQTLELEGLQSVAFASAPPALERLTRDWPGVIVSDIRMPDMDGLALFAEVRKIDPEIPVILVSAHGDIAMAVGAIREGAYDFIEKPASPDMFVETVRRALEKRRLVLENRTLRRKLAGSKEIDGRLIGVSPAIQATRDLIASLADADVDVLITGATGTGKELAARCLHELGGRRKGRFVALNCGALPETLIESELFGHEAGAFTGATRRRIGKIEHADGGTLFLDEIESMPLSLQVRLVRVLQEREIERIGGNEVIAVDIRVVVAAKADLAERCADGTFREDLYYRMDVAHVPMPPLVDRPEDICLLFRHFAESAAARYARPLPDPPVELTDVLMRHDWPGNVRELRNAAERFALGLPLDISSSESAEAPLFTGALTERMERFERDVIAEALRRNNGEIEKTAHDLGIPRKKLYLRMRKFALRREDFR